MNLNDSTQTNSMNSTNLEFNSNKLLIDELTRKILKESKKINEIYNELSESNKIMLLNSFLIRNMSYSFDVDDPKEKKKMIIHEIVEKTGSKLFGLYELLNKIKN